MRYSSLFLNVRVALALLLTTLLTRSASAHIPDPISAEDIKTYARWLRLNDDQFAILQALHADYEVKRQEDLFADARAYYAAFTAWIRRGDLGEEDPATFMQREYDALKSKRLDLLRRIAESDRAFFDQVRLILDEGALPRMQRVELGRKRAFYNRATGSTLPGGNVDLIDFIDALPLEQVDYDRLEREFIFEFEPRWVAALEQHLKVIWRALERQFETRAMMFQVQHGGLTEHEQFQLVDKHDAILARIGRDVLPSAQSLLKLNEQGVAAVADLLPDDVRQVFLQRWKEKTCPHVYPDLASAEALYTHAYALDDLTDDQRAAVRVYHEQFRRHHDALSEQLAEAIFNRHRATIGNDRTRYGTNNEYLLDACDVGERREILNEKQLSVLAGVLTPEQMATFPEWDFAKVPQPRPWDVKYEAEREAALRRAMLESFRKPGEYERAREKYLKELREEEERLREERDRR